MRVSSEASAACFRAACPCLRAWLAWVASHLFEQSSVPRLSSRSSASDRSWRASASAAYSLVRSCWPAVCRFDSSPGLTCRAQVHCKRQAAAKVQCGVVPGHDGGCSSRDTLGSDDHAHRLSASHDTPVGGRAPERVDCETSSARAGAENVPGAIWRLWAGACRDRGLKGIGPMYPSCATGWPSYARRATLERSLQQQAQAQSALLALPLPTPGRLARLAARQCASALGRMRCCVR